MLKIFECQLWRLLATLGEQTEITKGNHGVVIREDKNPTNPSSDASASRFLISCILPFYISSV